LNAKYDKIAYFEYQNKNYLFIEDVGYIKMDWFDP